MDTLDDKLPIKSYDREGLASVVSSCGQPSYRVNQLIQWMYQRGVSSYDHMTDLPRSFRETLAADHPLTMPTVVDRRVSKDGTRKYLLSFDDGSLVETVGIPSRDSRLTVCFSTQIGCPMGCVFCATGHEGFTRNLSVGEMIDQTIIVQKDMGRRVTNLVAMGQGEPFLNYDATIGALSIINSPKGLNIGARKITVSTCGIIKGIDEFSKIKEQYTLAVSLHSARQAIRDIIMPNASSNPLDLLKGALQRYIAQTNRRITFEYALIRDINDSDDDLQALISYARGLLCHINLIPLNAVETSPFKPSPEPNLMKWQATLEDAGFETTIRHSKGSDIFGACGQLKNFRG